MSHDPAAEQQPDDLSRRDFLHRTAAGTLAIAGGADTLTRGTAAHVGPPPAEAPAVPVMLQVNGRKHDLKLDPRVTLLDALRERLGITGPKKGCDHGQCGACTVLIDGRRANSCLALAVAHEEAQITTVEGLANGDALHALQRLFIAHDAFQCGYCTPGQLCSAVAMLEEAEAGWPSAVTSDLAVPRVALSDDEIRERMSGNLCRCGAYANIVPAIAEVAR